ncbi:hypothetical protein V5O48_012326 [Marasmius crinis-equi]|uniref:Uncharacterized protein n=1 Tax=Marasmius crinis-equi TaxID=585013 RepID=A0ABR3F3Q6_9AGAR
MDCILAYRLYAVYNPRTTNTPKHTFAVIFIPIVLFKVARWTNLVVWAVQMTTAVEKTGNGAANPYYHGTATKIEWILAVFDNWFVFRRAVHPVFLKFVSQLHLHLVSEAAVAWLYLGEIVRFSILSSFVFPCILSIVQVSITFKSGDFFLAAYIFVSNIYLEIICVMLATLWTVSTKTMDEASSAGTRLSEMSFRVRVTQNTEVTSDGSVQLNDFGRPGELQRGGKSTERGFEELKI